MGVFTRTMQDARDQWLIAGFQSESNRILQQWCGIFIAESMGHTLDHSPGKTAVSRTLLILISLIFLLAVTHPDTVQVWFGSAFDVVVDVVNSFWPW